MKILLVAMSESIHTVRWLSNLGSTGWDLHLFPSRVISNVNRELQHTTVHHTVYATNYKTDSTVKHRGIRLWTPVEAARISSLLQRGMNEYLPNYRVKKLCRLIQSLKPDIVHSMEIQHGGYLTLEAKQRLGDAFPPWIVSSWGNDIYLYRKIAAHREKVRAVLEAADYYIADCKRDIPLARELGFSGEVLGAYPGGGGYHLADIPDLQTLTAPSKRKVILLKGYQHYVGRALFGLRALALCSDILHDYEIVLYFPSSEVELAAEVIAHETGLNIRSFPTGTHAEWLELLASARINIGLAISDGTPLAMLESMLVGTFPIQAYTACADEWFSDGETGLIVPPEDPEAIAAAIRRAVTDAALVDTAAQRNMAFAKANLDYEPLRAKIVELYQTVMRDSHQP